MSYRPLHMDADVPENDPTTTSTGNGPQLPFIHACVARGSVVLAESSLAAGSFPAVVQALLDKVDTSKAVKVTLDSSGDGAAMSSFDGSATGSRGTGASRTSYAFHYVVDAGAGGIVYLCMTDSMRATQAQAFALLDDMRREFTRRHGREALTALPFGLNSFARVLQPLMEARNRGKAEEALLPPVTTGAAGDGGAGTDHMARVQSELASVRDVMHQNIDRVLDRGERIEVLVDKTADLNQAALAFKKRSTALRKRMWWKNARLQMLLALVGLIVLWLLVGAACGLPGWSKCMRT